MSKFISYLTAARDFRSSAEKKKCCARREEEDSLTIIIIAIIYSTLLEVGDVSFDEEYVM